MALSIISNYAANRALTNLNFTSTEASRSVAKLSSGTRVINAAEDAASLAIGSRLKAEVVSLNQAVVNAGQGSSMMQVADGALARAQDILNRMKGLAVQAGSANLGATERALLDVEYQNLLTEMDRLALDTKFGSRQLLTNMNQNLMFSNDGASTAANQFADGIFDDLSENAAISIGGGASAADARNGVINNTIRNFHNDAISRGGDGSINFAASAGTALDTHGAVVYQFTINGSGEGSGPGTASGSNASFQMTAAIDKGLIENPGTATADLITGTTLNFVMTEASSNLSELTREKGAITLSLDENFAISDITSSDASLGTAAMMANGSTDPDQFEANSPVNTFDYKVGTGILPAEDVVRVQISGIRTENLGLANTDIRTASRADAVNQALDQAIDLVVDVRSQVGAGSNRLEYASRNVRSTIENTEAARSTLMDLDVAQEVTTFTSKQILVQAGISTLAQANQLPQNLLQLFA